MMRLPLSLHSSAAARLRSCSICPSYQHHSFSTQTTAAEKKESKSPHSKLLRVCSSRNVNPHFAAIEGEMLRLDWDKSMKNLVADWAKNKRFDEFVELERNVKSYVEKNLAFITLDRDNYHSKKSILLEHYPYENIISSCVRFAISAPADKDNTESSGSKFDKNEAKIAMFDLQKRMEALATAGKLLEAMSALETQQTEDDNNTSEEASDMLNSYYKSCTNGYRLVVSGWFLLFRQQKTLHDKIISELNASDILSTTSKLKILPDGEAYDWANTWITFNSRSGRGGILPSDKPIFLAIAKVLLPHRQDTSSEFNDKLKQLFPEEENETK
eukprot:scaffold10698_cov213-Skeletonema_marinoi.AAC.9